MDTVDIRYHYRMTDDEDIEIKWSTWITETGRLTGKAKISSLGNKILEVEILKEKRYGFLHRKKMFIKDRFYVREEDVRVWKDIEDKKLLNFSKQKEENYE